MISHEEMHSLTKMILAQIHKNVKIQKQPDNDSDYTFVENKMCKYGIYSPNIKKESKEIIT